MSAEEVNFHRAFLVVACTTVLLSREIGRLTLLVRLRVRRAPARVSWCYSSSFSRFHQYDRPATTLLYDINSPRYDGAGDNAIYDQDRSGKMERYASRVAKLNSSPYATG